MITNLIIRGAKVHNLHCIQPSKPADRLYKSQAADGLAFLLILFPDSPALSAWRIFIRK